MKLSFYSSHPGLGWRLKRTLQMFLCLDSHLSKWPWSCSTAWIIHVTVWPEWSVVSKGKRLPFLDFFGGKWTRFRVQSLFIESDETQRVHVVWLEDVFMLNIMKAALRGLKTMKISRNFLREELAKVTKLWRAFKSVIKSQFCNAKKL